MNYINANINMSKNNRRIKTQKNKNNFNKSSKLRKNELKSKISINHTDKNSKILFTNSNNVFYNSIDFPSTTTSTNRTNHQSYLPYKDCIKTSIIKNSENYFLKKIDLENNNYYVKISMVFIFSMTFPLISSSKSYILLSNVLELMKETKLFQRYYKHQNTCFCAY